MRNLWALIVGVLILGCATASYQPIAVDIDHCYSSTDGVRYNHLYLHLQSGGTYQIKLQGDIGTPREASGTWEQERETIRLSQTSTKYLIAFPSHFQIQRSGSLKFDYQGPGYSAAGTDLIPRRCDR
jgi:hypothetical protein